MALSREHYTREEAARIMSDYKEEPIDPAWLEDDRVRFGCNASFDVEGPIWFTGASGRGSKAIWLLDDGVLAENLRLLQKGAT